MATDTETLVEQLDREKRTVSFDAYDITVRQLIDMVSNKEIEIAPEYQRHFLWDENRESELIESIFLGIPVPSLFMATNKDGTWEVVDGVQRLSTLLHFASNSNSIALIGRKRPLVLRGLSKLTALNDMALQDLPRSVQLNFMLRPMRVTTLNDRSDLDVRYDLFERLNTGGVKLHHQEIRNCVFRGKVREQLKELSRDANFRKVVRIQKSEQTEAIYEECVLRFFAFLDRYTEFGHLVDKFLTDYAKDKNAKGFGSDRIKLFEKTMAFLAAEIPGGIVRNRKNTPLNLYEAIAVGTAIVIESGNQPKQQVVKNLLTDKGLERFTQGGTNTKPMVSGRIEFVRDALT
jgi:hypothetical protein